MSMVSPNAVGDARGAPESAVREQLARILSNARFVHAHSLARLLQFVVEETLQGRQADLKEARLGLEVFHRPVHSYDCAIDPIVRVQMGRLRTRLGAYYATDGANDPVLIEVEKGTYVPEFSVREIGATALPAQALTPTPSLRPAPRLAVLPFVNMTAGAENEYFSDGLTEDIINLLARDRRLQVVARTSSFQFKGVARDVRDIARQLEVGIVLEGSVRRAGNRVRVTADLINAADACHVWSDRYEGEVEDIFTIQEQIAGAIRQALMAHLLDGGGTRAAARQTSGAAYNEYLQGRFLWNKRTERGLRAAIRHFEEAVRLDEGFARAYSGLADCYVMLAMSAAVDPQVAMPHARDDALKAIELDDTLAEAHASLAGVRNCFEWNRAAAEHQYRRAIACDPNWATTRHWFGLFLLATGGSFAGAIEQLETAIDLDPLSTPIIADLGLVHLFTGDYDAAADQCRRALELDPHFHRPYLFLGLNDAARGDFRSAQTSLEQALHLCTDQAFRSHVQGALGYCYARSGKKRKAESLLEDMSSGRGYVSRFAVAEVHAGRNDIPAALTALETAVSSRESFAIFTPVWPLFHDLRDQARFKALAGRLQAAGSKLP